MPHKPSAKTSFSLFIEHPQLELNYVLLASNLHCNFNTTVGGLSEATVATSLSAISYVQKIEKSKILTQYVTLI
jgi:hypothetical protein